MDTPGGEHDVEGEVPDEVDLDPSEARASELIAGLVEAAADAAVNPADGTDGADVGAVDRAQKSGDGASRVSSDRKHEGGEGWGSLLVLALLGAVCAVVITCAHKLKAYME